MESYWPDMVPQVPNFFRLNALWSKFGPCPMEALEKWFCSLINHIASIFPENWLHAFPCSCRQSCVKKCHSTRNQICMKPFTCESCHTKTADIVSCYHSKMKTLERWRALPRPALCVRILARQRISLVVKGFLFMPKEMQDTVKHPINSPF